MSFRQTIEAFDLLDDAKIDGLAVAEALRKRGLEAVAVTRVEGEKGHTDFIKAIIPGSKGRTSGGEAPTLGIIGRLGGIGARPQAMGLVSDGDGAVAAIAAAMKLGDMARKGDVLEGDVIVSTHICPNAPTIPHEPVPFMGSPVDMATMNRYEVDDQMDAILSIDTTKGNRVINVRRFAISPTVKEGYILRVSESLLDIMAITTGRAPVAFPVTTQDITPYGNGLYHLNSILQPATATSSPVVGVAITTEAVVPGCATGASHLTDIEEVVRFSIEVAKAFGSGKCDFFDEKEFERVVNLYGSMRHLMTLGAHQDNSKSE